jgi:DNA-binding NtrC family response regulator
MTTQTIPIRRPEPLVYEAILVIDDEPAVRAGLSRALRRAGYQVFVASGLVEARELVRRRSGIFDLLLGDVCIADGTSGPAIVGEIRAACPEAVALFMSGYDIDDLHELGVLPRDVEFIQKPFGTRALLHAIRTLLDSRGEFR